MQSTSLSDCCAVKQTAVQPQVRDSICDMMDALDKANCLVGTIEDKLFGANTTGECDKACPPQNIQEGLNRSKNAISILLNKLDSINSRL
jgi:hypothetical protein